jgi:hypothetical protein
MHGSERRSVAARRPPYRPIREAAPPGVDAALSGGRRNVRKTLIRGASGPDAMTASAFRSRFPS